MVGYAAVSSFFSFANATPYPVHTRNACLTNLTILTANYFGRLTIKTIKEVALSVTVIAMGFQLIEHTSCFDRSLSVKDKSHDSLSEPALSAHQKAGRGHVWKFEE